MNRPEKEENEEWSHKFLEKLERLADSDKDEIKVTLGNERNRISNDYFVKKEQLRDIVEYSKHLRVEANVKTITARYHANLLVYFANCLKKPFKEATKKDIRNFLLYVEDKGFSDAYIASLKMIIKSFYRWLYGLKKKDGYPEIVDWINTSRKGNTSELPKLISNDELIKMLENCDNLRDRALIHLLYDSGCRKGELIHLRVKDLVFDEFGGYILVNGKTGSRRVRLVSSIPDLKAWLNIHPLKNNPEAPLFVTLGSNNYGGFLSDTQVQNIVAKAAKRAKLGRHIYPHLFRHSNATRWAGFLKEPEMRIRYGWSRTSDMPTVYTHLSGADVDDKILVAAGLKNSEDDSKTFQKVPTKKCPRCMEDNPLTNKFCFKCGNPLDVQTIEKIETVKRIVSEVTMFIFEKMKERKIGEDDLEGIVKEWYESKK